MSEQASVPSSRGALEALLSDALAPIEPPARLMERVETRLQTIAQVAASELTSWADDISDAELKALRDPRNWFRPVLAVAAGGTAAGALVVLEWRRRRRPSGLRRIAPERLNRR